MVVSSAPTNIGNANSSANGAVSVAPVLSATTAGSLLVLMVSGVGTGTPGVTGVTDNKGNTWVQSQHTAFSTTQFCDIWITLNAASGTTTVTATLGGTLQGVSASAFEITGFPANANTEFAAGQTGTGTTTVTEQMTKSPVATQELNLLAVGYSAPTTFLTTTTRAPEWQWNPSGAALSDVTSTGGTNNIELRTYMCSNGPDNPYFRGTLGANATWATAYVRLLLPSLQSWGDTYAGGILGTMAPKFYTGTIGG